MHTSRLLPTALLLALLCACTGNPEKPAAWIEPVQAMLLAADADPAGIPGTFRIHVHATDHNEASGITYLSTERDYRDQRNLAVVIEPGAVAQLTERLGAPPADALRGRNLLITGEAKRVAIHFHQNGVRTGLYYYQTHLPVADAGQVRIVD